MLLPAAFRSLSRLSSALSAKASTLRPYQLDLISTVTVKMVFILTVILVPASDIALSFTGFVLLGKLFS